MNTLGQIQNALSGLSIDELRVLNSEVVNKIKWRHSLECRQKMAEINVGSIAKFYSKKLGRTVYIRVDKINSTTVSATECDELGNITGLNWRVSPTFLTLVK